MSMQADDNLITGYTYTFTFQDDDYVFAPSASDLINGLTQYAPDFITSVSVQDVGKSSFFQGGQVNVTFTYSGDGSDVASDVWNDMISAWSKTGTLGYSLHFVSGEVGSQGVTPQNPVSASVNQVVSPVVNAATQAVDTASKQVAKSTQDLLTPVEIAVGVVALVVAFVIFSAGKSGGVSASPEGFEVGGSR